MKNDPLVSIAMPFRNSARTLRTAIQSIVDQTYSQWQLLLPDDGSSDDSLRIARSFSDPRIVVWSDGQRKNLAARLNECIDRSAGPLFARMDADDLSYPERLERQVRFLQTHQEVDLLGAGMLVFTDNGRILGKRLGPPDHSEIVRFPTLAFRMFHPTFMGRIEWFRQYRYDPGASLGQDQELLFRAYGQSRYANLSDILLGYRENTVCLNKVFRSRYLWLKHISRRLHGPVGRMRLAGASCVFGARALLDCIAVVSGLRYTLLRQRARPVTEAEETAWSQVWDRCDRQEIETLRV